MHYFIQKHPDEKHYDIFNCKEDLAVKCSWHFTSSHWKRFLKDKKIYFDCVYYGKGYFKKTKQMESQNKTKTAIAIKSFKALRKRKTFK